MNKPNSKVICVLGMHRSGTSAITRAINLLGADLGDQEKLWPPGDDNPEGFWEHRDIVTVHEKILGVLKSYWDTTTPLPDKWWESKRMESYRSELEDIVVDQFINKPLWLWKDPRTCLLLPLWQEILAKLKIEVSYVVCFRNPVDVMKSLHRRNNFGTEKSYGIWILYTLSSLFWTLDSKRVILRYDSFLEDWEPSLRRISNTLSIPWPEDDSELRSEMVDFIKPTLRHNHSAEDVFSISQLPKPVLLAFKLCLECETNPEYLNSINFRNEVNIQYSDYLSYYDLLKNIEPSADDIVEVFWTSNEVFTQDRSFRTNIKSDGEFHEYILDIDSEISQLRFDPTNFSAAFVDINSIELLRCNDDERYDTLVSWSESTNFTGLSLGNQCRLLDNNKNLLILITGNDPNLVLGNIPAIKSDVHLKCKIIMRVIKIDESIFQLLVEHFSGLDQQLEQTREEILICMEKVKFKEELLAQKNKEVELRDHELFGIKEYVEGLSYELKKSQKIISEQDKVVKVKMCELDIIKLEVAQAEKQLVLKDKELTKVSEEIKATKFELEERTNILLDTKNRLDLILSSKSWRFINFFRR